MARKRYKPEEIVSLLRQAEVLHGQGLSMADAIRQLGISEVTFYRWRKEYAGMSGDQLRRLKELEKENERLRRAVSLRRLLRPRALVLNAGGKAGLVDPLGRIVGLFAESGLHRVNDLLVEVAVQLEHDDRGRLGVALLKVKLLDLMIDARPNNVLHDVITGLSADRAGQNDCRGEHGGNDDAFHRFSPSS